jgi:2'-5' RNA ligase
METIILHCALEKKIQDFQNQIIKEVAEKFDLRKILIQNVEPHFTLKYHMPVNESQLGIIEDFLREFCSARDRTPVKVGGYTSFGKSVIYTSVLFSDAALQIFREFNRRLRTFDWVVWSEFDAENLIAHATIVEQCEEKYDYIVKFLGPREKHFDTWFDNITIVKKIKEEDEISFWETVSRFDFKT